MNIDLPPRLVAVLDGQALPSTVTSSASHGLVRYLDAVGDDSEWFLAQIENTEFAERLIKVFGCSPFVADACQLRPAMLRDLVDSGDLECSYDEQAYRSRLEKLLASATDVAGLHRTLRQFRNREMVRIVWRDFTRQADLWETTGDVTRLAEACIQCTIDFLYPRLCETMGTPVGKESGQPQSLVVLGMGKMGAWELNVSSDIDLIFTFPEAGQTEGGRRQLSNQEFFVKLGQQLIQALDNKTVDGFVFRVDMRLRPYGQSGALALNFDAMEEYYQAQGRDWERYAMIKARVVAGDAEAGRRLMTILRPFTYRKYIDFSAIQSLRDMKALINRELKRQGLEQDIKKGAGGIREVEFIAQAFQLIRGGKDDRFQNPALREILPLLDREGLLPDGVPDQLIRAYEFLRNTEHGIQGYKDQQSQQLPSDGAGRESLAVVMGFESWDAFAAILAEHRDRVHRVFAEIASDPVTQDSEGTDLASTRELWLSGADRTTLAADLADLGFSDPETVADALVGLRDHRSVTGLASGARGRLDAFMPMLIAACAEQPGGGDTLIRVLPFVQGVLRRSAYLVLLIENPEALRQLVHLCGSSRWIAEQIGQFPALLDELLDPRALYTPADRDSMAQDLRQQVLRLSPDDLEAQMEVLRYFRRAHALRITACEVDGALPLMKVSDNLTWLAEVILEHVLNLAWDWMIERHGRPGRASETDPDPGLLVLGYGKLGGIELGHGSDLDLVFIHNANAGIATTGERSVDNATFFMRLGQRIIHMLSTHTLSGALYEVDMRLRPNGNSGMLVASLTAFEKYQHEGAWTWEHQALVRARPVAGNEMIGKAFTAIRERVLRQAREAEELRDEVLEMRAKMRAHLGSKRTGPDDIEQFHIKQDTGGIVDIEFIVQYFVLLESCNHPDLVVYTDNMRILDAIEGCGLLPPDRVAALQQAYIFFRSLGHRLNLQGEGSTIGAGNDYWQEAKGHRVEVSRIWQEVFGQG